MKNILLCNNSMGIGGVETVILNQVTAFTKKGYNVYVVAGKGIYSDKIEELGGNFIELEFPEGNTINVDRINKLVQTIKEKQITEIHIHKYQCIPTVMLAAFITKIPYFAYEHGIRDTKKYYTWKYPLYKTLFPIYFKNAYKIIAITPKVAEFTQKEYEIQKDKYVIVHNGIDFEKYMNLEPKYSGKLNNIYIISRLNEEKLNTIFEGIEIYTKIYENNNEAKLYIVGGGEESTEIKIKQHIKDLHLPSDIINLLGPQTDIIKYLKKADLLLGVDRCILEGIAMKVPVVVTGYNGINGIITKENINLALEENFSGDNMKVITVDECVDMILQLGENRKELIEENYKIATQKLDCYKNYINIPEEVQIEFDWINLFGIIKKGTDLIESQYVDIKAKYDWIQKIEKENKELLEKNITEENEKLKIEEENRELQKKIEDIYSSKSWKYAQKINKIFNHED